MMQRIIFLDKLCQIIFDFELALSLFMFIVEDWSVLHIVMNAIIVNNFCRCIYKGSRE